jgi:16S rRNA (adenine1518-N6/adenine1519-N6)-dimethyltransferase
VTLSGADIAQLLSAHGLRPSRALGQNFVTDPNTVRRIARLAGAGPETPVLEIGAGLGSLTLALAETGAEVVAVEADRHLVPVLRTVVEGTGVEVVEGDALELDLAGLLAARHPGPWSLVANLPYNVATPLVLRTLTEVPAVAHLLVMVQREVGERMAAAAGEDPYGAVSVRVAYFARAEVVGRVPASVFLPRPRVESVLVRLERRPEPAVDPDPAAFERAGVRPDARAEELDVAAWGRLAAL